MQQNFTKQLLEDLSLDDLMLEENPARTLSGDESVLIYGENLTKVNSSENKWLTYLKQSSLLDQKK